MVGKTVLSVMHQACVVSNLLIKLVDKYAVTTVPCHAGLSVIFCAVRIV